MTLKHLPLFLCLCLIPSFSFALDKGQIKAKSVEGSVKITLPNQTPHQLKNDELLSEAAIITTGAESSATLLFSNGSTIRITRNTVFKVKTFEQAPFNPSEGSFDTLTKDPSESKTELFLQRGRLLFDVKSLSPTSSYTISTPAGSAGIRGTNGEVSYFEDTRNRKYEMCIILGKGKLQLNSELDPRIAQIQLQEEKAVCFSGDLTESGQPAGGPASISSEGGLSSTPSGPSGGGTPPPSPSPNAFSAPPPPPTLIPINVTNISPIYPIVPTDPIKKTPNTPNDPSIVSP